MPVVMGIDVIRAGVAMIVMSLVVVVGVVVAMWSIPPGVHRLGRRPRVVLSDPLAAPKGGHPVGEARDQPLRVQASRASLKLRWWNAGRVIRCRTTGAAPAA